MQTIQILFGVIALFIAARASAQMHYPDPFRDDIDPHLTLIGSDVRNVIVLIHGWNPPDPFRFGRVAENKYVEEPLWSDLRNALFSRLTGGDWKVVLYHWEQDAATGLLDFNPLNGALVQDAVAHGTEAANRAVLHGVFLGNQLNQQAPNLRRVHIIAHSAGAWAAREAALSLLQVNPYVIVQITFCDAFIPGSIPTPWTPSRTPLVAGRINDLAWVSQNDRIFRLDNYYADDIKTMGTDVTFSWRSGTDVMGQKTDYGTGLGCYNGHSGPIPFITDTVVATTPPSFSYAACLQGLGIFDFSQRGWFVSIFQQSPLHPRITVHPQTQSTNNGASVSLTVTAISSQAMNYQWFKNGQPIPGATGSSYNFTASSATVGDYVIRVANINGKLFSDKAAVSLQSAPPAAPAITYVSPPTLPPSFSTQLFNIYGSNFKPPGDANTSTLIFRDPAYIPYVRTPIFVSSSQLQYYITVQSAVGPWSVTVTNAGQAASNLKTFLVETPPPNTGSLTVNLSPSGAASAGAQWRVDGGSYRNTGDTATGLTPGSHTLSFKSVSGYTKPSDMPVSITAGANTTITGNYTVDAPATYTLNLSAMHGSVTARPDLNEYPAGTEVRLFAYPDDGYVFDHWSGSAGGSDDTVYVTMSRDRSVTANFAVDTSVGHIRVDILPPQAVAEGAQWKYRNYTAWQNSGYLLDYIPPGNGYVYFKDIPGWITPNQIQAPIIGGQTVVVNATYQEILGGVQVTLTPDQAGVSGGRWRLDSGAWIESGVALADVSTGSHVIEFLTVPGWTTPPSQMVSVERGVISTRNGVYVPPAGLPVITSISPKTGPISGGTTVTIDGVNFQAGATVSFGGVAATSVTVVSSTRITANTPPRASYGSVALSLTSGGQTLTISNGFSYLNSLGSNIELVGQIGGNVEAVAVAGNLCYYGEGTSLVIADFANSAAPVERGRITLPAFVRGLAVSGNIVYVANSYAGLYAVDVSSPATPLIVGFFDTDFAAQGVAIDGSLAYVADGLSGLMILDVGNPAAIVRLGATDTAGFASQVAFGTIGADKYAFVAESDSALRVIKVTVPSSPVEITNVPGQSSAGIKDVKLVGTTLYVSDWQAGVKIFNASNPTNLVQIGLRDNVGAGAFFDIVGDRLYACAGQLRVFDLTVIPTPAHLGSFEAGSFCYKLVVANGLAFAAMGSEGLRVVSVSNPASMSLRSAIQTLGGVEDVWVLGGVAFVGNNSGLHTVDVSNPARPVRLATLPGERVTDIVVADGKATLVNYGDETVRIVNVANPSSPSLLGTYTSLEVWNVALKGNSPVLAAATRDAAHRPKMDILNLQSPSNPQSSASLVLDNSNGIAAAVAIVGDWAFVGRRGWAGNPSNGLDVVSLANPASPQKIGSLPLGSDFFRNIAASTNGNCVYLPLASGFQVIDTTEKGSPVLGQVIDSPQSSGSVDSIQVSGSRLFVNEGGFIFAFDITVPSSPVLIGYYDILSVAYGIAVDGDLIFVAGANAGVSVLRLKDVNNPTVSIINPTSNTQMQTNASPITLSGAASDNQAVTRVIWENNRGGSGVAAGTNMWSVTGLALSPGANVITITAFDDAGNSGNDSITVTYDAPKQSQTITFPALVNRTFGDTTFALVTTSSSGLPVFFTIASGPASVSDNIVTLTGAGIVTVRAQQAGDTNFNAAPPVDRSFSVAGMDQAITFSVPVDKAVGDAPFALNATASSGLPVSFSIVFGPATISSNVVTLTGVGTVTVRVSQPGNSNFNPAPDVERSFAVGKMPQFITFGTLSQQVIGDAPFTLSAPASSGLPVNFSVLSGPAIVSGNVVTITGTGLAVLRASQPGDATFAPAPNADQVLVIAPGHNVLTDLQRLANGMFTFRYFGEAGTNYVVEGSTDLVNWLALATNQVSGLGFLEFTDVTSTNYNWRFYRIAP